MVLAILFTKCCSQEYRITSYNVCYTKLLRSVVVLGQNYLAKNIGFASGITFGLYFSAGGMLMPLIGRFADNYGLQATMLLLTGFAFLAAICTFILPNPLKSYTTEAKTV